MAPQPPRPLDRLSSAGRRWRRTAARALPLGFALCACDQVRRLPQRYLDSRTPRERYEAGLAEAGLGGSALVRDWLAAGERALTEAPAVSLLHREEGFLDPATPAAFGYRFRVERGQEASLEMAIVGDSASQVFLDAWLVVDSAGTLDRVAASDSGARVLTFEPRRAGDYVLRAQPELLRGGRFTITVRVGPTMAFPVLRGRDTDIGSPFGAPRDGGSRAHHGIDIFARRGTPALAVTDAYVARVDSSGLGGLVVWLRDRRGHALYYAHLDSQLVREGDRVSAGDAVGLVGRTGNARATPAHLHFGLYRRGEGPVDPLWFVRRVNGTVPRLAVDTTLFGGWGRTRRPLVVTAAPDARAAARDSVPRDAPVLVLGAVGRWYRIQMPDGRSGYLPAARVQHAGAGAARLRMDQETVVARQPGGAGDPAEGVALLATGDTVTVLGQSGASLLIRTPRGRAGWIRQAHAASAAVD
jgi:murein DD-endopeptidase MepM/ murein hydrolase activator NlpD